MEFKLPVTPQIGSLKCPFHDLDRQSESIPVYEGFLKHLTRDKLFEHLNNPHVTTKYIKAVLEHGHWQIIKTFPTSLLLKILATADIRESRKAALRFLLVP